MCFGNIEVRHHLSTGIATPAKLPCHSRSLTSVPSVGLRYSHLGDSGKPHVRNWAIVPNDLHRAVATIAGHLFKARPPASHPCRAPWRWTTPPSEAAPPETTRNCLSWQFQACPIADALSMCFNLAMSRSKNIIAAVGVSFATAFLSSCTSPISDPVMLRAIESEARLLITDRPLSPSVGQVDIPIRRLPPKIASLSPKAVTVSRWGVDIIVKPGFDGGYGYAVPQSPEDLPMPATCYSNLGQGVFWHGPC